MLVYTLSISMHMSKPCTNADPDVGFTSPVIWPQKYNNTKLSYSRQRLSSKDFLSIWVLTMLMNEVFPAPLGPNIPKHSPEGTARDNPRTAIFGGFPSLPGYTFFIVLHTIAWLVLCARISFWTFSL